MKQNERKRHLRSYSVGAGRANKLCDAFDRGRIREERDEVRAILGYMLEHNEHHTRELKALSKSLSELGYCAEAEMLILGISNYRKGNEMLSKALLSLHDR